MQEEVAKATEPPADASKGGADAPLGSAWDPDMPLSLPAPADEGVDAAHHHHSPHHAGGGGGIFGRGSLEKTKRSSKEMG